jgi:hypothetical protein
VPSPSSFDYAIIRVVPRVEREEFLNAGVVLYCLACDFLDAKVSLDEARLRALAPEALPELETYRHYLEAIPRICRGGPDAGPVGQLSQKERWHWLVAPRSTVIQTGPVHSGICDSPAATLDALMEKLVTRRG